jgi:hypothetical protein
MALRAPSLIGGKTSKPCAVGFGGLASAFGFYALQQQRQAENETKLAMVNESRALAALSDRFPYKRADQEGDSFGFVGSSSSSGSSSVTGEAWSSLISAIAPPTTVGRYDDITEAEGRIALRTHTAFSASGDIAFTATGKEKAKVWDPHREGKIIHEFSGITGRLFQL